MIVPIFAFDVFLKHSVIVIVVKFKGMIIMSLFFFEFRQVVLIDFYALWLDMDEGNRNKETCCKRVGNAHDGWT